MLKNIDVTFDATWSSASIWSGSLEFRMTNNTGATLNNPEVKFQLGQGCSVLENTGFTFVQRDDIITGYLKPHLSRLPHRGTVSFSVGTSFPEGNNHHLLPVAYWVNGKSATHGGTQPDVTPPLPPSEIHLLSVTSGSILLSWTPSTDDGQVDHYSVSYTAVGTVPQHVNVTSSTATLDNLSADTTYTISVTATDTAGNVSLPSDAITVTTEPASADTIPPSIPTGLKTSKITGHSISLTWNATTDNVAVTGYRVKYRPKGGDSKIQSVTATSCTLENLTGDTAYQFCIAACDAQNNLSSYSAIVEGKTLTSAKVTTMFAPYLDVTLNANWNGSAPSLNTQYVTDALKLNVKHFHLAFLVQDGTSKQLVWGNSSFPYGSIQPLSDKINQAGGEVIVAFGGANGTDPSVSYTQSELTQVYLNLKKDFNVRHIDFDFESVGQYNYKVAFPAALAAQKQDPQLWFSLTLPVLPTGLVSAGIEMLKYARDIGLNLYVQIMAMDYGSSGTDMGDAAISAIEGTRANLASIYPDHSAVELYKMIGVITMIGQNDTVGEMFSFQDTVQTTEYAKQKGLYLISMWSLSRDFPGMGDLATCSRNPAQTKEYEYTTTFLQALGSSEQPS